MPGTLHGFGLGLRPPHYADIVAGTPAVDWFEILTENYLVPGGAPLYWLDRIAERYPLAMHGVSLSIGGSDALDLDYLRAVRALERRLRPALLSDHLCWTGMDGQRLHDLLPLPHTRATVRHVAGRVRRVQDFLGRQLLLENVSGYLRPAGDEMDEAAFLATVVAESGCALLLDINNVYVNAHNHGFDAHDCLDRLPALAVRQIHLAGHGADAQGSGLLIDTHDRPVCEAVWALYAHALRRFGQVPTMIERDADIPPLAELVAELDHARAIAATVHLPLAASA